MSLVLTRKVDQKIVIGGNIIVTILAVNGTQVKIGIEAPREVTVDREEIAVKKDAERAPGQARQS